MLSINEYLFLYSGVYMKWLPVDCVYLTSEGRLQIGSLAGASLAYHSESSKKALEVGENGNITEPKESEKEVSKSKNSEKKRKMKEEAHAAKLKEKESKKHRITSSKLRHSKYEKEITITNSSHSLSDIINNEECVIIDTSDTIIGDGGGAPMNESHLDDLNLDYEDFISKITNTNEEKAVSVTKPVNPLKTDERATKKLKSSSEKPKYKDTKDVKERESLSNIPANCLNIVAPEIILGADPSIASTIFVAGSILAQILSGKCLIKVLLHLYLVVLSIFTDWISLKWSRTVAVKRSRCSTFIARWAPRRSWATTTSTRCLTLNSLGALLRFFSFC